VNENTTSKIEVTLKLNDLERRLLLRFLQVFESMSNFKITTEVEDNGENVCDDSNNELLLSLFGMARKLGVTQQWLRGQADDDEIPCLRAGNRYLFNPLAVQVALSAKAARMWRMFKDDQEEELEDDCDESAI
jgi:hypothetical protein